MLDGPEDRPKGTSGWAKGNQGMGQR
ncbi:hypothetical protein AZE42_13379, partial [Rhizopogon vesiculosus]